MSAASREPTYRGIVEDLSNGTRVLVCKCSRVMRNKSPIFVVPSCWASSYFLPFYMGIRSMVSSCAKTSVLCRREASMRSPMMRAKVYSAVPCRCHLFFNACSLGGNLLRRIAKLLSPKKGTRLRACLTSPTPVLVQFGQSLSLAMCPFGYTSNTLCLTRPKRMVWRLSY